MKNIKYVFESLEDTFKFGKFKGYTLREVFTGNEMVDPKLLFAFLKHLIDSNDPSLLIPKKIVFKLFVEQVDETVIKFEYKDLDPIVRQSIPHGNNSSGFMDNLINRLVFNKPDSNLLTILNGNYSIIDFFLKEQTDTVKLPGASSSAIAWYIKNVDAFSINPNVLNSLFSFYTFEFIGLELSMIRNLTFSYKPYFKHERITFSEDLIKKNSFKYESRNINQNKSDTDNRSYHRYQGSYASDVMGFSDQDIDDAFDGNPDAYWNID